MWNLIILKKKEIFEKKYNNILKKIEHYESLLSITGS